MALSLEKMRQVRELGKTGQSIEPVQEIFLANDIPQLGKLTFTEQEWGRFGFMDVYGNMDTEVTIEEITNHIMSLREQFKKENSANFFNEQKDILLHTVVDRFMLGGIMAKGDKTGGNVTTVHNAQQKIYAQEKDEYDRTKYEGSLNSENKKFKGYGKNSVGSEFTRSQLDKNGNLTDAYTGKTKKGSDTSPDHVYSLSEYHKNGGYMQNTKKKADFATDKDNLASTDRSINKSLSDRDKEEWMDSKSNGREVTNEEYFEIDRPRVEEKVKQGKETAKKHLPTNGEKAVYYTKNTAITSIGEGGKMGVRQAVSSFITELINAIFDEIRDCCMRVKKLGEKWYKGLSERLKRIGARIAGNWKKFLEAGKDGFISGFCSNIVTVIINIFVTTSKRIVQLIREGFFSLVKAIKLLLNPPADMTKSQLFDEVGKIIISGSVITFGLLAKEAIDKVPLMAAIKKIPFIGDVLSAVLCGLLTAIVTSLALWGWDKLDLFGFKKEQQHKFVMEALERERQERDKKHEEWLETIRQENPEWYEYLKAELAFG
jgi:hypothetical protein